MNHRVFAKKSLVKYVALALAAALPKFVQYVKTNRVPVSRRYVKSVANSLVYAQPPHALSAIVCRVYVIKGKPLL